MVANILAISNPVKPTDDFKWPTPHPIESLRKNFAKKNIFLVIQEKI